ncbi:multidrug resistance protein MdtN [Roseimaritima multifibrata]|uniref:Multidrug resistance protein MdtN n=1 Tax=Roseimaritima multifibrata TaxID=1930274 RepID=A0A517MNW1_9BACT|nr:efflux RND transporter periplasmic adaptor subunit [Roseimaritima multifibrata]QDS96573.1 multidrug resistance protein MdtN [Roseimaritima multifibrata]
MPCISRSISILLPMVLMCGHVLGQGDSPQFDGLLEPLHDIELAASEVGVVAYVGVKIGDRVREGQVIARLNDESQRLSVAIAKQSAATRGAILAAEAEYNLHLNRTEQMRQLRQEDYIRPDELKRAEADLEIAANRWLQAKEEASLRQEELKRAENQLRRQTIIAPIDGVIAKTYRQPGEYVSPGDPVIARLISTDQLIAVVNVPTRYLSLAKTGNQATVFTTTPRQSITGTILTVSPMIDGESGTIQVRVSLNLKSSSCLAGDRCTVAFSQAKAELQIGRSNAPSNSRRQ